jgi:hypothetical protein
VTRTKKIILRQLLTPALLLALPFLALADTKFYGGLDAQYGLMDINGEAFNPVLGRLNGGLWLREGVGIEAMLGATLNDDSNGSLNIDVPSLQSVSLRLQSPEDMHTKAYMLFGYARYELEGSVSDSNFPGSESFAGASVSVGFMRRTSLAENISAYFEFTSYLANEDVEFGGVSLGLRYGY